MGILTLSFLFPSTSPMNKLPESSNGIQQNLASGEIRWTRQQWMKDDFAVDRGLKDVSTRLKFVTQSPCVGEVSVVGNRYLASIAIHNQWLNILCMGSPVVE